MSGDGQISDLPNATDRVIKQRFACRQFSNRPLPRHLIEEVLEVARYAPSAGNTQPWHVYVLAGDAKRDVSASLLKAQDEERDQHAAEYTYYASPMPDRYLSRREEFGRIFFGSLGVERSDMGARADVTRRNFTFFDAPVGLIVTIDRRMALGSWLDMGIFLQNIMIAAGARGIETCPQETFSKYHLLLRDSLSIPPEQMVVCGMSVGYADEEFRRAGSQMPRAPVDEFASFMGFEKKSKV